jgi:tetratricopeptide (TPR) repeat protein
LMYQQRDHEAIGYFERALRLDARNYDSWMYLAIAYRRAMLPAKSMMANLKGRELAEQDIERNPRKGSSRYFMAYMCARLQDRQRAESEIAQALQLSPGDANTLWMAALTYEALGLRDRTIEILKHASPGVLADLSRWPDVADLKKDPSFVRLLGLTKANGE